MNRVSSIARGRALCVAVFLSAGVLGGPLQAGLIDSFSAVEGGNTDTASTTGSAFGPLVHFVITPTIGDPIGSRRSFEVDVFVVGETSSITVDGVSGAAVFAATNNAVSTFHILYGVGLGGGLHFDATAGGANAFRLTFGSFDPDLEYAIGAFGYSAGGTSNSGTFQPISAVVDVPFASFSSSGSIGFNDLNQIQIRLRDSGLTRGGTAQLLQFETVFVPEPTALALLCVALSGMTLAVVRRCRERARSLALA